MKRALQVSALTAIFAVSGCSTVEYVRVQPECSPPPEPLLPEIDRGEVWDRLGEERYRVLEMYIDTLWGYADEQAAMLDELCVK